MVPDECHFLIDFESVYLQLRSSRWSVSPRIRQSHMMNE